jgi:hypothetical protein
VGETKGLDAFRAFGDAFFGAAPDAKIFADRTFEVGDVVVYRRSLHRNADLRPRR